MRLCEGDLTKLKPASRHWEQHPRLFCRDPNHLVLKPRKSHLYIHEAMPGGQCLPESPWPHPTRARSCRATQMRCALHRWSSAAPALPLYALWGDAKTLGDQQWSMAETSFSQSLCRAALLKCSAECSGQDAGYVRALQHHVVLALAVRPPQEDVLVVRARRHNCAVRAELCREHLPRMTRQQHGRREQR